MCGISGIVGRGARTADVERMARATRHRGPDDSGAWESPSGGVALGHNRLSIIDLSPLGRQPMSDRSGTRWITFNGEVYNYLELRRELAHYPFRTRTDTEVILAAHETWGPKCVERFIGMFSFAIWDEDRRELFAVRDRLGIKPFQYTLADDRLLFASEAKALFAAGIEAKPDLRTWADYLVHGLMDHSDATFFEGVRSLPPGHHLTFREGKAAVAPYWDLPALASTGLDPSDDEAAAGFLDRLRDSVRLRLRSDVPVGLNLSGGLDSASLFAVTDEVREPGGRMETFTAVYGDPRYDEDGFAAEVRTTKEWTRHSIRVTPEVAWGLLEDVVRHQEAPFGGLSTIAYHALHGFARERGVTVLLEGQGVDEMLAGYAYFADAEKLDMQGGPATAATATYQDGTRHLRPDCVASEIVALAGDPPSFPQPFRTNLANALYRDLRYTKLPRVLRMNDRLSMAHGRELRVPYLDHRIVEYAFRLPGRLKRRNGETKFLLRHAMRSRLPDAVRATPKRAVVTPQREWLRGPWRAGVEAILESESFARRGLFDPGRVRAAYREFCDGKDENSFHVWQWINTEMWFRVFVDGATRDTRREARA